MSKYLISDTHFDDPEILEESQRDFDGITEMNQTIIRNWNDMVDETDAVLFGGDLTHSGVDKQGFYEWVYTVNGIELILRGNHDPYNRSELADAALPIVETHEFSYGGYDFQCSHKYSTVPERAEEWCIHGHNHHHRPFLDVENNRINISADVLGYTPIALDELISYLDQGDYLEYRPHKTA
jgi:calcineurin-like phosphoesterase family protein